MNVATFILQKHLISIIRTSEISGSVTVTNEPEIIFKSDKLVLPGVGAFC